MNGNYNLYSSNALLDQAVVDCGLFSLIGSSWTIEAVSRHSCNVMHLVGKSQHKLA